MAHAIPQTCNV